MRSTLIRAVPVLAASAVACCLFATTEALADDKAVCLDASLQAQAQRAAHKLVEARAALRTCAAPQCPGVVKADCATWLTEVESALPTVVPSARDAAGADLVDVKVTVDGQPLVSKLDGQAVPLNAGPHTFHFERSDGSSQDRRAVVREGEKNQPVAAVLSAAAATRPQPAPGDRPDAPVERSSSWKTVGWVLGGAGVVGLGVGTAFGVVALGDKSSDCASNGACKNGTLGGIKSAALASDIGLIAGGVLLAGGAALVLLSRGDHEATAGLRRVTVAPLVTAGGGRLLLGATF